MQDSALYSYEKNLTRSKGPKWFLLVVFLLILAGVGYAGYRYFVAGNSASQTKKISATPTPTAFVFPTDTPTPALSQTPTPSGKTTPSPTPKSGSTTVDKKTGLDRADLTVAVQNGSGTVGAATKASDEMKGFGYHVVSVGNASNFSYEDITIQVKSTFSKYLPLLKSDLGASHTVASASATLPASSASDAVVIFGKE